MCYIPFPVDLLYHRLLLLPTRTRLNEFTEPSEMRFMRPQRMAEDLVGGAKIYVYRVQEKIN